MTWRYKSPLGFPARYPEAVRKSVAYLNTPVLLFEGPHPAARADAENFRFFRWCVRQKPEVSWTLARPLSTYLFRTSLDRHGPVTLLYLTASKTSTSDLLDLNPELEELIIKCQ